MSDHSNFDFSSPIVRRGYEYWKQKSGEKSMPVWADILPAEIKALLPNMVVTHVLSDPLDFIERITGGEILNHSSRNSMGIRWREFEGRGPDSQIWKSFAEVAERKQPSFQAVPYIGPKKDFLTVEVVSCPISDDGQSVNKIISFVDYLSRSD